MSKKKHELEVLGVPVHGHEEDYLFTDTDHYCAISSLMKKVGAETVQSSVISSFDYHEYSLAPSEELQAQLDLGLDNIYLHEHEINEILEYRKSSGKNHPTFYKIKLVIEAEPCSQEESEEIWKNIQKKNHQETI